MVLGHFYQREDVVRHADYIGDSFQLANAAKAHPGAEAIVFCGVHFMAETADLLSRPDQAVILPNLAAGRSEEHTSELQSLMRISYAVFCLKKKKKSTYTVLQSTFTQ